MPPSVEIFTKLLGGFLVVGAGAAAIVAWWPACAEFVSRHVVGWRALAALLLLAVAWNRIPVGWRPVVQCSLLGLALLTIPLILGIFLFPAETRDGRVVDPGGETPAGPGLGDRLRAPWSSASPDRPPAVVDLARSALVAYATPQEWETAVPRLGFAGQVPFVCGSAKGLVLLLGDEAVIAFQGTDDFGDWFTNLDNDLALPPEDPVHRGFLAAYRSVAGQIDAILAGRGIRHVWITGHSLGGAMGVLCAIDLIRRGTIDVRGAITFGQPLLLAPSFAPRANDLLAGRFLRFIHEDDVVPRVVPGLRGGGSTMWFKGGDLVFGGARMRFTATDGQEAEWQEASEPGPTPLSEEEFEREKERMREARVEAADPGTTARMQSLPNVADHSMERYVAAVEARFPPAPDPPPAPR